jgi:hypothetical protein
VTFREFLWRKKAYWITPIVVFLLLLVLLILWLDASAVIPFNYAVQ